MYGGASVSTRWSVPGPLQICRGPLHEIFSPKWKCLSNAPGYLRHEVAAHSLREPQNTSQMQLELSSGCIQEVSWRPATAGWRKCQLDAALNFLEGGCDENQDWILLQPISSVPVFQLSSGIAKVQICAIFIINIAIYIQETIGRLCF